MYVYFLREAAWLAELCGRNCVAAEYRIRADSVSQAIERLCWCEEAGLYSDETNGKYFSMENAFPLETKCTFAYAYFWFRALEAVGLYEKTDMMMNRLRGLPAMGCTTIPETPDAPRSDCHAWGAIAIYEFAAVVLGVRTISAAERKIRIAPRIDGRTYAKGDVYTGGGKVFVNWKVENDVFTLTVKSDEGTHNEIVLPDGDVQYADAAEVTYTAAVPKMR